MSIVYNPNSNVANVAFNAAVTRSATITGVTAGNTIIALISSVDTNGSVRSLSSLSDGQGSYTTDASQSGNGCLCVVASLFNANAGSHTVSVTLSGAGAFSYGYMYVVEVAGIGTSDSFDQSAGTTGNSLTMSTGATGTLAVANEIAFAINGTIAGGAGTYNYPPTGFTQIHAGQDGSSNSFDSQNYQIVASTSAITADWGSVSSNVKHSCLVATYQGAVVAPGNIGPTPWQDIGGMGSVVAM
jgi:hypothetical protein